MMLQGKVVIVTGAGSGIGESTALVMAKEGAKLVLADIDNEALEKTCAAAKQLGAEATSIVTDVTNASQVENMVAHAVDTYGRLDCAFNNAGIEGQKVPFAEFDEERFDRTIAINLKGVFLCMKYEILAMEKCGGGSIVNNSSVMGLIGAPLMADYNASKHGIIGLTKAAALDYSQKNIRVNAVCPGAVETSMVKKIMATEPHVLENVLAAVPANRLATTDEIGEAVVWLCSDRSSFSTGTTLVVDGGYVAQ